MQPFFSIIVPCYNVEAYVGKCLESLTAQTNVPECEFIIVNDGSTDNTLDVIKSYAERDSRIRVIDKPNGGVSSARNSALEIVRGKYIYFVDGDDWLDHDALETAYSLLKKGDADMLLTNITYKYSESESIFSHGLMSGDYTVRELFKRVTFFPTPPKNIYLLDIVLLYGIRFDEDLKVGEVYAFTVKFLQYAQKIRVSGHSFYEYVMHGESATHKPNYLSDSSVILTLKLLASMSGAVRDNASYDVTAFKIAASFTYNKYLRAHDKSREATDVVRAVLKNSDFRHFLNRTCFGWHCAHKERLQALYINIFGIHGFRLLNKII